MQVKSAGVKANGLIVDSTGAALSRSTTQTRAQEASLNGESYNIATGFISLTTTNESAIFYYKHNEDKPLIIDSFIVGIESNGTDSNPTPELKVITNPASGTIISGALPVAAKVSRNLGTPYALDASIAYKGADGATVTGGTEWAPAVFIPQGRIPLSVDLVMPKGSSVAVTLKLQQASSPVRVYLAALCSLKQGD